MISFDPNSQQTLPVSSVKIIGLGGAGSNMLERTAKDALPGVELLCVNTDIRTIKNSSAQEKIQLGSHLTKGLGAGGDPEVGLKAARESEDEIREALRGKKMVFLCVGLGGGTGSGAAPLICRFAREEGAFVVVFSTMPFTFEGSRRKEQAETSLNELSVLANALVTFDNDRMGELLVEEKGIHEAFSAADTMVSDAVKSVIRMVVNPGLIHVGLDDLMSALGSSRSMCLFGTGAAKGKDRIKNALKNTLASPLLDKGKLLEDVSTVLVHICGGETLSLDEVEELMRGLGKHISKDAHLLFGAAVDKKMGDALRVTLVSALPEHHVTNDTDEIEDSELEQEVEEEVFTDDSSPLFDTDEQSHSEMQEREATEDAEDDEEKASFQDSVSEIEESEQSEESEEEGAPETDDDEVTHDEENDEVNELESDEEVVAIQGEETESTSPEVHNEDASTHSASEKPVDEDDEIEQEHASDSVQSDDHDEEDLEEEKLESETKEESTSDDLPEVDLFTKPEDKELSRYAPGKDAQAELELGSVPKGKFDGEDPNLSDGEDLDIPPYLRKKRN